MAVDHNGQLESWPIRLTESQISSIEVSLKDAMKHSYRALKSETIEDLRYWNWEAFSDLLDIVREMLKSAKGEN